MKTMVPLRRLLEEVENENLDVDTTLIDTESIAVLDDDHTINSEQPGLEDQEDS